MPNESGSSASRTSVATIAAGVLVSMAAAGVLRLALLWLSRDALADLTRSELLSVAVMGMRLDAVFVAYACLPATLAAGLPGRAAARFVSGYVALLVGVSVLAQAADLLFFRYYSSRLNYLVLEHGADIEVWRAILRNQIGVGWLAVTAAGLGLAHALQRLLARALSGFSALRLRWLAPLACTGLAVLAARGTLQHRPLNPSAAAVTSNRVANEITASGAYNVFYESVLKLQGMSPSLASVVELPGSDAELRLRAERMVEQRGPLTHDSANPLVHEVSRAQPASRPLNVVVVVMESFTGQLVASVGGHAGFSPEFDALAKQGLLLTHCYATGERTVQGLEAVVSSFPPLPGVAAVRRAESSGGFSTLASVLSQRDYDSVFLYGGQGIFDHMRGFFLNNGFQGFVEERDFERPSFRGSWGVSDEDLFQRANRELQARWETGRPFLATILTVSLHTPWEYPRGRAPLLPPGTRAIGDFEPDELGTFLYADFALGEFIREARTLPYFKDTVFVMVGDHGTHFRRREVLPSEEYVVPALFLSPGHISPGRIDTVTSQLDLAPTVLGLLGGSFRSPFFGRDVLAAGESEGFAPLVYKKSVYGVRRADRLTVVGGAGRPSVAYRVRPDSTTVPTAMSPAHREDELDLLAMLSMADRMLRARHYTHLPLPPGAHAERTVSSRVGLPVGGR